MTERERKEINTCLNCTKKRCIGDYPMCQATRSFEYGNSLTKEVARLTKLGQTRRQIADQYGISSNTVGSLLHKAKELGYITQEEADATKVYKRKN